MHITHWVFDRVWHIVAILIQFRFPNKSGQALRAQPLAAEASQACISSTFWHIFSIQPQPKVGDDPLYRVDIALIHFIQHLLGYHNSVPN